MIEVVGWIAASAGGLAGAIYIGRVGWRVARTVERVHHLVEHEFKPNGGSSLRDQTNRIEAKLTEHLAESSADQDRLAAIERHLGIGG